MSEEAAENAGNPVMAAIDTVVSTDTTGENPDTRETELDIRDTESMLALNLSIGGKVFPARLYDNAAARELVERMPMELTMGELHGNEKYYYLQDSLPTDTQSIGSIHTGDIMLYGSDCLVLFYEDFQTSFSYTRLGYLEEPEKLSEILGDGNVKVSFNME